MSHWLARLRPRIEWPNLAGYSGIDRIAFWLGTGIGTGVLRPAPGTWGSLFGMLYLGCWSMIPTCAGKIGAELILLCASLWAAGRCEILLKCKDPHSVVVDEIVAVPFAFWPLVLSHESRHWIWVAAFVVYRVSDILKPWPACRVEKMKGGFGIVADDIVSATYTSLLLYWMEHLFPHQI